jgi:hypothetical protein
MAPDLKTCYDLRPAIEENCRNSFLPLFPKTFTRRNAVADFQKDRPRVEIRATIGGQRRHLQLCVDNQERFDQWDFQLRIQCVTQPVNSPDDNVLHDAFVAQVRAFCGTLAQGTWNDLANWPYHAIAEPLMETGTEDTLKTEQGLEYSVIGFNGVIAVRETAWPN